jgi:hypothetical protein
MMYRFRARRFRRMLSYHVRPIGPILTPGCLCTLYSFTVPPEVCPDQNGAPCDKIQ